MATKRGPYKKHVIAKEPEKAEELAANFGLSDFNNKLVKAIEAGGEHPFTESWNYTRMDLLRRVSQALSEKNRYSKSNLTRAAIRRQLAKAAKACEVVKHALGEWGSSDPMPLGLSTPRQAWF